MPLICFSVASIAKTHRLLQAVRSQLEGNRDTDVRETVEKFTQSAHSTRSTVQCLVAVFAVALLQKIGPLHCGGGGGAVISFLFPKCSDVVATVNNLWLSQLFAELGVSSKELVQERHNFLTVAPPLVRLFFREHVPSCLVCFSLRQHHLSHPLKKLSVA